MRIKICGLTRYEDAAYALQQGAWALGFIFTPLSKRCITPEDAAEVMDRLPPEALITGVFVNQIKEAIFTAADLPLKMIQLHGDETPEDCATLKKATGVNIIKALRLKTEADLAQVQAYQDHADYLLIDAAADGQYGGSGETADWGLAAKAVENSALPVILAGGLGPQNITKAATAVPAHAFDLSSGVEDRPGIKNHDMIKSLFEGAPA